MDQLRWQALVAEGRRVYLQFWLPQPGSQGAGACPPWWAAWALGPLRRDCGGSFGNGAFFIVGCMCCVFVNTSVVQKMDLCLQHTLGVGEGRQKDSCFMCVDFGVPDLTSGLGIVPTSFLRDQRPQEALVGPSMKIPFGF